MNNHHQHEPVILSVESSTAQKASEPNAAEQKATEHNTAEHRRSNGKFQQAWDTLRPNVEKLWQYGQHGITKLMTVALVMMLWLMTMLLVTVSGTIALCTTLWQNMKTDSPSKPNQPDLNASA